MEHQARMQVAFEWAREWLQNVADCQKANHDQHVRDDLLVEGQLVYLQECVMKGHHRIQDLWSSVVYW